MDLKLSEVAKILHVSEATVERWIVEGHLSAYRFQDQILFSKEEIELSILKGKIGQEQMPPFGDSWQSFALYRALHRGPFLQLEGRTKEELIREGVSHFRQDLGVHSLGELFLEREALMTTAIGNGVAIPHSRECLLSTPYDFVSFARIKEPVEWGALDGKKVGVLFFLAACDDRRHLHLLAKLAHLISSETIDLFSIETKDQLLEEVKQFEKELTLNG